MHIYCSSKWFLLAKSDFFFAKTSILFIFKRFPPLIARYVPFAAVACANCINIPCMRSRELLEGIPVFTSDGEKVGESKKASKKAIAQVTFSRITMAAPSMCKFILIFVGLRTSTRASVYESISQIHFKYSVTREVLFYRPRNETFV